VSRLSTCRLVSFFSSLTDPHSSHSSLANGYRPLARSGSSYFRLVNISGYQPCSLSPTAQHLSRHLLCTITLGSTRSIILSAPYLLPFPFFCFASHLPISRSPPYTSSHVDVLASKMDASTTLLSFCYPPTHPRFWFLLSLSLTHFLDKSLLSSILSRSRCYLDDSVFFVSFFPLLVHLFLRRVFVLTSLLYFLDFLTQQLEVQLFYGLLFLWTRQFARERGRRHLSFVRDALLLVWFNLA